MLPDSVAQAVCQAVGQLVDLGFNRGASGNISVRTGQGFVVTPSGVPVERLNPQSLVAMSLAGEVLSAGKPSSEWRFHRDLYVNRPDVGAVVHAHSPFATALACLRRDIPPFHYMIAMAGGDTIRCCDYALFGTQALSDAIVLAMQGRKACLMANHGMLATGRSLAAAMALAIEVESLCEQYWRALQIGEPVLLSAEQMQAVHVQFQDYGDPAHRV
jgi:L-fuculose-phosphate aldolase